MWTTPEFQLYENENENEKETTIKGNTALLTAHKTASDLRSQVWRAKFERAHGKSLNLKFSVLVAVYYTVAH